MNVGRTPASGEVAARGLKATKDTDVRVQNISFVALRRWRARSVEGVFCRVIDAVIHKGRSSPDILGKRFFLCEVLADFGRELPL